LAETLRQRPELAPPEIAVTSVPTDPPGEGMASERIKGTVGGVNPRDYKVVIYARSGDKRWAQPRVGDSRRHGVRSFAGENVIQTGGYLRDDPWCWRGCYRCGEEQTGKEIKPEQLSKRNGQVIGYSRANHIHPKTSVTAFRKQMGNTTFNPFYSTLEAHDPNLSPRGSGCHRSLAVLVTDTLVLWGVVEGQHPDLPIIARTKEKPFSVGIAN